MVTYRSDLRLLASLSPSLPLCCSALVGDQGWVDHLPLAARGPGEPFVTAAGVLGLMCMWRGFYCTHLDTWSNADEQQRRRWARRKAIGQAWMVKSATGAACLLAMS